MEYFSIKTDKKGDPTTKLRQEVKNIKYVKEKRIRRQKFLQQRVSR